MKFEKIHNKGQARLFKNWFQNHPDQSLVDQCRTAAAGRTHFSHRLAVTGQTRQ